MAEIVFQLNGEVCRLKGDEVEPSMTLNQFIREKTNFKGTKLVCGEGGCGACVVSLSQPGQQEVSINSCLKPLSSLHGCSVTTTEGLTQQSGDLHPVQERICKMNGSQCGFCTPGMVMTTYTARRSASCQGKKLTMDQMEGKFDGNICRCTGYRPILDAAKSFCDNTDIEDLVGKGSAFAKHSPGDYDHGKYDPSYPPLSLPSPPPISEFQSKIYSGLRWVRVSSLSDALSSLKKEGEKGYMVCGSTGWGVYHQEFPAKDRVYIDISSLPELHETGFEEKKVLKIGAGTTLSSLLTLLQEAEEKEGEELNQSFKELRHTVERIGNLHVRNTGSVGGNLMMGLKNNFLSDLLSYLAGIESEVIWASLGDDGEKVVFQSQSIRDFLFKNQDLHAPPRILTHIRISGHTSCGNVRFFKEAIRPQNAHAIVNGGFSATFSDDKKQITSIKSAFGGFYYGQKLFVAEELEKFVSEGGCELSHQGFQPALAALKKDIAVWQEKRSSPDIVTFPVLPRDNLEFRVNLVQNFFFKFFVDCMVKASVEVPEEYKSASTDYERQFSTSKQSIEMSKVDAPVSEPVTKITAPLQATGKAKYIEDFPLKAGTLFGSLVTSTVANAKVKSISAERAEKAYPNDFKLLITHKEIPGANLSSPMDPELPVLAGGEKRVSFYGEPVAFVVATTREIAQFCAEMVNVEYEDVQEAILTIKQAKEKGDTYKMKGKQFPQKEKSKQIIDQKNRILKFQTGVPIVFGDPLPTKVANKTDEEIEEVLKNSDHVVEGAVSLSSQNHFYLENQSAEAWFDEERVCLQVATQGVADMQEHIQMNTGLPRHKIQVFNRRIGGSFGAKFQGANSIATLCVLAAQALSCPIRTSLTRRQDMMMTGGREEIESAYKVGFDKTGKITAFCTQNDLDVGCYFDFSFASHMHVAEIGREVYNFPVFSVDNSFYLTTKPSRNPVRGPAALHCTYIVENVIEKIATFLGMAPMEVRAKNYLQDKKHFSVPRMSLECQERIGGPVEAAEKFNKENRYKKRGVAVTPAAFAPLPLAKNALVNVFGDGTIVVHCGTTEIGQGSWTKLAQATVRAFRKSVFGTTETDQIKVSDVEVQGIDTHSLPNTSITGGSSGSETSAAAAAMAAEKIGERLKPLLEKLQSDGKEANWSSVCKLASMINVSMSEAAMHPAIDKYFVYGVCASEVEIDVLTGRTETLSSRLLFDCGKSLNPAIDIGQIEGAFVFGVGLMLYEKPSYLENGKQETAGTWEYKPPLAAQTPTYFEVETLKKSTWDEGFLSSKATGEPPLLLACSVGIAVQHAVNAARKDAGLEPIHDLPLPLTVDVVQQACGGSSILPK